MQDMVESILGGTSEGGGVGNILGGLMGAGGGAAALVPALLALLTSQGGAAGQPGGAGGLGSLVSMFQNAGLGDIVGSWVGTGPNKAISADQVQQGLGADTMNQLAAQSGLSVGQVAEHLSTVLPGLVNEVTPGGKMPDLASLQGMFGGLLGK